ncbi:RelE/StbE family addiction module toxin [Agrobacterium tumefaciens]|nr:RelE/StbE family addiction module toxin [Agrobacterium tumefaciens]
MGRFARIRELVINGSPYVAALLIAEATVRILGVLHGVLASLTVAVQSHSLETAMRIRCRSASGQSPPRHATFVIWFKELHVGRVIPLFHGRLFVQTSEY